MKFGRELYILLAVSLLISSCNKFITPEDLGKNILKSFQKKDVDLGLNYIMYENDYEDFFSDSQLSENEKDRLIKKHSKPSYVEERVRRFKVRFAEIINEGENAGIIWGKTVFEYIEGPKDKSFKGLQSDEIYVFFSFNSKIYKLRLDDCYKCSRGWLMSDEPSFEGIVN